MDIPVKFLTSVWLCQAFLHLGWCWLWGSHMQLSFFWAIFPLVLHLIVLLSCWILSKAFSTSIQWSYYFALSLCMWLITFIGLCILNLIWISGIKPIQSQNIIFFIYVYILFARILLTIIESMFIRDISL